MVSLGLGSKLCLVLSKDCLPIHGILLIKLLNHMVSLGLGSKLCLVLCKYRLPIGGFLLIESLNHTTSLALGPKFLSIAGKDSFTLNQILTNLSHLGLAVDLSNDSRCLGLGSKLCLVLSKDCLPIHGILLIKLLNHMVSLGLGSKLCLVLS